MVGLCANEEERMMSADSANTTERDLISRELATNAGNRQLSLIFSLFSFVVQLSSACNFQLRSARAHKQLDKSAQSNDDHDDDDHTQTNSAQ